MAAGDPERAPPSQPALYRAHRVLIGAAVALGVIIGVWGIWTYRTEGDVRSLWTGLASWVVGAALAWYLWRFNRRTRS